MHYRIRATKTNGTLAVEFRYWVIDHIEKDGVIKTTRKLKTVPTNEFPTFHNENEVILYMPLLEAKYDSQKLEKERRELWHDQYYNFIGLREQYIGHAKERSPRTFAAKLGYLDNYIFQFFLNEKRCDNLDQWYTHFMEFRQWLKKTESFRIKGKLLALNTVNHCILELNMFLEFMAKLGVCRMQPKCDVFAGAKIDSRKGLDSVFTNEEADEVYEFLLLKRKFLADSFWLLLKTGMRISEFRGIGPANVKMGKIPQNSLVSHMESAKTPDYSLFIHFTGQVDGNVSYRDKNDMVKFIPLKSKRNMGPENARYVPLFDTRASLIIKEYMEIAKDKYSESTYGAKIEQYPFFYDHVTQTMLNIALAEFYEQNPQYHRKTCHDCRHTYATWLGEYDITGTLQEYICGHQKESAKRYNHLKEQLAERIKLDTDNIFDGW